MDDELMNTVISIIACVILGSAIIGALIWIVSTI